MLNKIARVLKPRGAPAGFQAYLNSIQRVGGPAGPTMDEAKRDYSNICHPWFGNIG